MLVQALAVLVIDDSKSILKRVQEVLAARGHQVTIAESPKAGLSCLAGALPDLILLDVEMPGMSGYQLCEYIRRHPEWAGLPVVFLSGRTDEESVLKGFEAGGNDYIAKPFSENELVARVETHGSKARIERELAAKTRALEDLSARQESIIADRTSALVKSQAELTSVLAVLARERTTQDELVNARKLESMGKLVADVAHQINTPLGNSITLVSFIRGKLGQPDETVQAGLNGQLASCLGIIEQNLGRIDELVSRFRNIAINQYNEPLTASSFAPLVELVGLRFNHVLAERSVKLAFDLPEDSAFTGYPHLLALILESLIQNCLEHGLSGKEGAAITITGRFGADEIALSCADNGSGMDSETLKHVWEPFFTTRRQSGSLGLGLFVVHNLVIGKLKGTVACESKPGAGACFTLRFPRRLGESAAQPLAAPPPMP